MLLWEKIKDAETFLSLGLLTRHRVNSQNCDLSACSKTGKANIPIPTSVITAVLPAVEFVGRFARAAPRRALLSPRRSQSRVSQKCPWPAGPPAQSRARPRDRTGTGQGQARAVHTGRSRPRVAGRPPREQGLCQSCTARAAAAAPHCRGMSNVQTPCLLGEPPI